MVHHDLPALPPTTWSFRPEVRLSFRRILQVISHSTVPVLTHDRDSDLVHPIFFLASVVSRLEIVFAYRYYARLSLRRVSLVAFALYPL